MMEAVRQWAAVVCFSAIAGGIFLLAVPQTSLNKVMRLTVSIFFLCSVVLPFTKMNLPSSLDGLMIEEEKTGKIAEQVTKASEDSAYRAAKANINQTLELILKNMGIKPVSTAINISTNQEGELLVEARLQLRETDRSREGEIEKKLSDGGLTIDITYTAEEAAP